MQVKIIVITVLTLVVLSVLGGIYGSLKIDINNKDKEIRELKEYNSSLVTELAVEKMNVVTLKESIYKINAELDKVSIKNKAIEEEMKKWHEGYVDIKYENELLNKLFDKSLYLDNACQNGLMINKMISELKYEDL